MSAEDLRRIGGVSEDDLARLVALLDGRLEHAERLRLELRLGSEPDLARAFEELAETDAEVRAALATSPAVSATQPGDWMDEPSRMWLRQRLVGAVAVGFALLAWALVTLVRDREPASPAKVAFRAGAVATAPADADLGELLGFDPDWLPLGNGYRAPGAEEPPAADEYVDALTEVLEARAEEALADGAEELRADSFVVAFRPDRACHVVLVVTGPDRPTLRLLPERAPGERYEPGRTYLLPEAPLSLPDGWRESQTASYDPGVLTRDGARATLAVRAEPPTDELLRELDERLATGAAEGEPLARWLEQRGFAVRELSVDRP